VLLKSVLTEQPILRLVWSEAAVLMRDATSVTFVGYSMPVTDIAAAVLFRENLPHVSLDRVYVVDTSDDAEHRTRLMEAYRQVFPRLDDVQFSFVGAEE